MQRKFIVRQKYSLSLSLLPMIRECLVYKTILALVKFIQCKDDSASVDIIVAIFRNGLTATFVMFALVVGVAVPMFIFKYLQKLSAPVP